MVFFLNFLFKQKYTIFNDLNHYQRCKEEKEKFHTIADIK